VVSNFDSRLHGILRGFSIHDSFRQVLCSSEVGSAKPDATIFLAGCKALNLPPEQVLHVGDDRRADYHGAHGAGLLARWLNRSLAAGNEEEIPQVGSLAEIAGLVQD
jgi:putative hydrolase of the HAD superfamily